MYQRAVYYERNLHVVEIQGLHLTLKFDLEKGEELPVKYQQENRYRLFWVDDETGFVYSNPGAGHLQVCPWPPARRPSLRLIDSAARIAGWWSAPAP